MKRDATIRPLPVKVSVTVGTPTIKMWTYLSKHHIQAAARFARLSAGLERAHEGKSSPDLFVEHRAYVMASILMAASFLEATINELFAVVADGRLSGLSSEVSSLMTNMWKRFIRGRRPSLGTLEKYQLALTLTDRQLFDTGVRPYQDVQLVLDLRNALVHYVPEWATAGVETTAALSKLGNGLKTKGFALNPLTAKGNPFYPDKCLSHGCARWAVESALEFANEFFVRMGLAPTYDDVRPTLNTE